jgi:peptidoglycan hydrolase-like protein with peptidoglycan-binding domain
MFPTLPVPTDTNPKPPTWQALFAFLATLGHLPTPANVTFRLYPVLVPEVSIQFHANERHMVDEWLLALGGARGAVTESSSLWMYRGEVDNVAGYHVEVWASVDRVVR